VATMKPYRGVLARVLAWFVIGLSLLAMIGHTTGISFLFQQFGPVGMAANTAVCLLALSIAVILVSRGE